MTSFSPLPIGLITAVHLFRSVLAIPYPWGGAPSASGEEEPLKIHVGLPVVSFTLK
jgi:hypothetical protein